jgi:hypothetical protein
LAAVCFGGAILGIPFVTRGGEDWVNVIDVYIGILSFPVVAAIMAFALVHIYGLERFSDDMEKACPPIGALKSSWLAICWKYTIPCWTFALVVFGIISASNSSFLGDGNGAAYPQWSVTVGWCIAMCPILALLVVSVSACSQPLRHSSRSFSDSGSGSGYALSSVGAQNARI